MRLYFFNSYKNVKKAIKKCLSHNDFSCFLGCTPNSNFSANHEYNENDQDNENHPETIKMKVIK